MKQTLIFSALALIGCFSIGCERLPGGPITPDGYSPPEPTKDNIKNMVRNAVKNMVFIEGGSYLMGNFICFSGNLDEMVKKFQIPLIFCRTNEGPLHNVTLDSFYLNKYEISYYEYDLFTQAVNRPFIQYDYLNPQWWKTRGETREAIVKKFTNFRTGKSPAAIDWFQARDYCRWLGVVTGLPIDLPTESEWEYAARNRGQDYPYATDNGKIEPGRNYPSKENNKRQSVNSHLPNPLGLHHMSFNSQEWVKDWFDENYYKYSPENNPQGPKYGSKKILRGGVEGNRPEFNHNFQRVGEDIDYTHNKKTLEMFDFDEGYALSNHGARCAIHYTKPIDINNLKIDLSKPAPDSRAEWIATKDALTAETE